MNKIFINIAAYRDPELIPTVRDAIKQAKHKERLSFGICWQFNKDEPENFNEDEDSLFEGVRVRYIRVPAEESYGMNWARKLAHGFWTKDCNFYLQIDSHMRFVKNWDWELLNLLARCDSKKPILTQRCFPYYPEQGGKKKDIQGSTFMHAKKFRDNGVLALSAGHVNSKREKIRNPFPQAFISGHFMFAQSYLIKEMPYDEDIAIIATGDEPLLGMKAWTRGWDIFAPHKPVLYHHFYREQSPKFHMDHKKSDELPWRDLAERGVTRSNQINYKNLTGKYGLGTKRTLEEFEKYAGVDFKKRKVITEARIKKVYKDERQSKTINAEDSGEKIFVQIASYRDPDLEATIENMIENAHRPDNLIVGICDQYGPENKHLKYFDQENFRVIRLPFYASKGLGWARAAIQDLYFEGDAKYTMQLDSHMRFVKDWDKKLIKMLKQTGSEKPIISHYCPGFSTKDLKDEKYLNKSKGLMKMYCLRFNDTGTVSFRQMLVSDKEMEKSKGKPLPSMLVSGHFYFTLTKHIKEYRYDPNLYFAGDEISLATRSWTRGWDIFNPSENVVFHNYTREKRICHWSDQKVGYGSLHKESLKRLRKMLHREDNEMDIGEYGLGTERKLKDYENISGIDFKNRKLEFRAQQGKPLLPDASLFDFAPTMQSRTKLAEAKLANGTLSLTESNGSYSISHSRKGQVMHSEATSSEHLLGSLGVARLDYDSTGRVLIGGLGLGFTLKGALESVGNKTIIEVAEVVPEVIEWNQNYLKNLNGRLLDHQQVEIQEMDVSHLIQKAKPDSYDAILLDVDNGPHSLLKETNDIIYSKKGMQSIRKALKDDGRLVVWSSGGSEPFEELADQLGLQMEIVRAKATPTSKKRAYFLYVVDFQRKDSPKKEEASIV